MCDYSLEFIAADRPNSARQFQGRSIGFIAPGDPSTAVCMAWDTKLRLEGVPEMVQRVHGVSANENGTMVPITMGCASPMVRK